MHNYLAAHAICNNYRWNYGAEEFQLILKLVCGCEPTKTKRRSVRPLTKNFANTSVSALCVADFLAPQFEL